VREERFKAGGDRPTGSMHSRISALCWRYELSGAGEPYLATQMQGYGWSAGYVLFVLFCGVTAWRGLALVRGKDAELKLAGAEQPGSKRRRLRCC